MADRFLTVADVCERVTLSKTHIYRLVRAGRFPGPVPIGPHRTAFLEREVQDWMHERIRARDRGERAAERSCRAAAARRGRRA